MPRRAGGLKRRNDVTLLEDMALDELACIAFFGNLVDPSGEVLFSATQAQQDEAWRLLRARRGDA
jgi:hypothetical protein